MLTFAVVTRTPVAWVTIRSIRALLPDAAIHAVAPDGVVIGEAFMAQLEAEGVKDFHILPADFSQKDIHDQFSGQSLAGLLFVMEEGTLLLKDPASFIPVERLAEYPVAYSRQYMYTRRMGYNRSYRALGLNPRVDRHYGVVIHNLDHAWTDTDFLSLTAAFRHGTDPLLTQYLGGRSLIKHAVEGTEAIVIDYWSLLVDPDLSVQSAYASPFEFYAPYLDQAGSLLDPKDVAVARKNIERSAFMIPMRLALTQTGLEDESPLAAQEKADAS